MRYENFKRFKVAGIVIDQNVSGEIALISIIRNVNSRFKFIYRKTKCLIWYPTVQIIEYELTNVETAYLIRANKSLYMVYD